MQNIFHWGDSVYFKVLSDEGTSFKCVNKDPGFTGENSNIYEFKNCDYIFHTYKCIEIEEYQYKDSQYQKIIFDMINDNYHPDDFIICEIKYEELKKFEDAGADDIYCRESFIAYIDELGYYQNKLFELDQSHIDILKYKHYDLYASLMELRNYKIGFIAQNNECIEENRKEEFDKFIADYDLICIPGFDKYYNTYRI